MMPSYEAVRNFSLPFSSTWWCHLRNAKVLSIWWNEKKKGRVYWTTWGFTLSNDYLSHQEFPFRIFMVDTLFRNLKSVCVKSSHTTTDEQFNTDMLVSDFRVWKLPRQIIPAHSCRWVAHGGERSPFASAGFQFKIQVEARATDYQDQARHLANRPTITSVLSM